MQPDKLLEIHTKAAEILSKIISSTVTIVEYNFKISKYESMTAFQKYECIYTDADFRAKRDLYRRYRRMLYHKYDRVMELLQINFQIQ